MICKRTFQSTLHELLYPLPDVPPTISPIISLIIVVGYSVISCSTTAFISEQRTQSTSGLLPPFPHGVAWAYVTSFSKKFHVPPQSSCFSVFVSIPPGIFAINLFIRDENESWFSKDPMFSVLFICNITLVPFNRIEIMGFICFEWQKLEFVETQ